MSIAALPTNLTPRRELNIQFVCQPKQSYLLHLFSSPGPTWICYGGARGGGKSGGIRYVQLDRRLANPGTRGLIFRRTKRELYENHIEKLFLEFPQLRKYFTKEPVPQVMIPTGKDIFSTIVFGYGDHEKDFAKLLGIEYMDICADQAEQLTESEMNALKMCNRWPGVPMDECKMGLFPNPGGQGHAFMKRVFHDKQYHGDEDANDYAFIPAYGWDNIEWSRHALMDDGFKFEIHDEARAQRGKCPCAYCEYYRWPEQKQFEYFVTRTDYGRKLNRLPESLKVGHLFGRWDVFAGQYFDNFDISKHVVRPEAMGLKPWFPRWIALDWGYAHNAVVYWGAQDGNRVMLYRELVRNHIGPKALAQEICEITKQCQEKIEAVYLPWDTFVTKHTEDSIAEQMRQIFIANGLPSPRKCDDDRVGGWMLMREMWDSYCVCESCNKNTAMSRFEGDRTVLCGHCQKILYPRNFYPGDLIVGSNCHALIECIPMMNRDKVKVEDCEKFDGDPETGRVGDDAADAARYAVKSRLGTRRAPLEERVLAKIQHIPQTDLHSRAMMFQKIAEQEKKKDKPVKFFKRPRRAGWQN